MGQLHLVNELDSTCRQPNRQRGRDGASCRVAADGEPNCADPWRYERQRCGLRRTGLVRGEGRLHTWSLNAIGYAGNTIGAKRVEALHSLLYPQQPEATMPVGSGLCKQPAKPSTSSISLRKRKGPDSVPRTSKHTHPDPNPIYASVGSSIPAPAHRSIPLSRPRPTGTKLVLSTLFCWPNATPQFCAGRTMTARMLVQPIAALFTLVH